MQAVLARLCAGEVVVLDGALGAAAASGVLHDTKKLVSLGLLRSDAVYAEAGVQMLAELTSRGSGEKTAGRGASLMRTIYSAMPGLWDSYRLIAWLHAESTVVAPLGAAVRSRGTAALDAAIVSLRAVLQAIGDAERRLSLPMSPAWPAEGLQADPQGALLSVSGFNGTRYALHTDSGARATRKLTAIYYPRFEPAWAPGSGGELRVVLADGSNTTVSPLADRLILFNSELLHEVLPAQSPRVSLTAWGLGRGTRRRAAPTALDMSLQCTSDMCRQAQREHEAKRRERQARQQAEMAHAMRVGMAMGQDAWFAQGLRV